MRALISTVVLAISGTASAQASHEDLDQVQHALKEAKPAPGLDAAPTGAPRWCQSAST
jgi:hypothetical protein